MRSLLPLLLAACAFAAPTAPKKKPEPIKPLTPAQKSDYTKVVQPMFDAQCVSCHGPKKEKGKLRLDTLANTLKASENGKSVIPGKSADSSLVKAVARLVEDDAMPPEGKGKPLTAEQIGLIRAWIDQGAK